MDARDRIIEQLTARVEALERENAMLWNLLRMGPDEEEARWPPLSFAEEALFAPTQPPAVLQEATEPMTAGSGFNKYAPPAKKISLFRSLFHGREDVYARRWQSVKTGKSGYSPACANEWKPGVCPKPKGSCKDCEHRELLPLTDAVIETHLRGRDTYGRDVIGVYPILPDDSCRFLALDFDDEGWQENVTAVREVYRRWELPCAVERSRSGEGAHLWLFFETAVPCAETRRLRTALLTAAMESGGALKLTSYDRMFPNQDTLPSEAALLSVKSTNPGKCQDWKKQPSPIIKPCSTRGRLLR